MKMTETTVRRGLYGMFAGGLLAFGSAAIVMPVANAEPATPGMGTDSCSVSSIATTSSAVSASTSTYLASNPAANDALTDIVTQQSTQQPAPMTATPASSTDAFRAYFDQNPQVESELKTINQPVVDLSTKCGVELTPTPISAALADL
jgi:hemophore-related protein